jgi:hypothetical protein
LSQHFEVAFSFAPFWQRWLVRNMVDSEAGGTANTQEAAVRIRAAESVFVLKNDILHTLALLCSASAARLQLLFLL